MALDKHHAPPEMEAVEKNGCTGCNFLTQEGCIVRTEIPCCPCCRPDGCSVIFVPSAKLSTASWPYDSEGTPVEVEP